MILVATGLMMALVIYFLAQESKANKLKQVVGWLFGVGLFGVFGVGFLYITLIFKKIMLFDDRIEVYCLNKVIVRTYSQIKSFKLFEYELTKNLILECEPKFMHAYLCNTLLHKNELYKIKEILIKKGVKNNG